MVLITHLIDPVKLGHLTADNRSLNTQDWREGDIIAIWCWKWGNHCIWSLASSCIAHAIELWQIEEKECSLSDILSSPCIFGTVDINLLKLYGAESYEDSTLTCVPGANGTGHCYNYDVSLTNSALNTQSRTNDKPDPTGMTIGTI